MNTKDNDIECNEDRYSIATTLIIVSSAIILIFTIVALGMAKEGIKDIKDIFSMVLPVISTWVGAVIAYYFSKDNFETAAKTNEALIKQLSPQEKLKAVTAKEAMTLKHEISFISLDEKEEKDILLKSAVLESNEKANRFPFFKGDKIVYMLHKSIIDEFLVKFTNKENPMANFSLKNLLDEPYYKNLAIKSFEYAKTTDDLSVIKKQMDENKICSDVFITEDGTKDTKVLGWVSNAKLMKYAQV